MPDWLHCLWDSGGEDHQGGRVWLGRTSHLLAAVREGEGIEGERREEQRGKEGGKDRQILWLKEARGQDKARHFLKARPSDL